MWQHKKSNRNAGLIHRAYAVETAKHPLKYYADTGCFKVYALDVGLLWAIARSPVELLAQGERLFNEYEGAFVENYVAQHLVSDIPQPLYYWRSKGGKAELDFLCEFRDRICPLEVKAGINPKSKSLKSYDLQFKPSLLARTNLLNFKKDDKICNLPLYAVSLLTRLVKRLKNPRTGGKTMPTSWACRPTYDTDENETRKVD